MCSYKVSSCLRHRAEGREEVAHLRTVGLPCSKSKHLASHGRSLLLDRCKRRRVTLDRLTDAPLHRVQLHASLHLESVLPRLASLRVGRDTDDDQPLLVG